MQTVKIWQGVRYPDSHLVSLLHNIKLKNDGFAVDIGCCSGRHVKLMAELGFDVVGVECDRDSLLQCYNNNIPVINATLETLTLEKQPELIVAWGISMLGNISNFVERVSKYRATWVVLDWRNLDNSFFSADDTIHHGGGRITIGPSGQHLAGQDYRVFSKEECQLPGYKRTFCQKVTVDRTISNQTQCSSWFHTIHKLQDT